MDHISQNPDLLIGIEIITKSLIITGFTFILLFLLRKQAATLRHQICAISLLSLPLLLISSALMPSIPLRILPAPPPIETTPPITLDLPPIGAPIFTEEPIAQPEPSVAIASSIQIQEMPQENTYMPSWPLLIWLSGASLLLLHFIFNILRRHHFTRQAIPLTNNTWENHSKQTCIQLHLKPTVKILKSHQIQIPLTYGWLKPVILLPNDAETWSTEQQRIVLLHEMAHIKRKDQFIQSLCHISNALYWFNPFVWAIKRRLQTEQERACDDYVINSGITASDYATQLLNIARTLNPTPQLATVPFARKADLPDRIRLILNNHINRKPTSAFTSLFAILLIIVPTFAIAPLHTAQKTAPEKIQSNTLSQTLQNEKLIARITQRGTQTDTTLLWKPSPQYLNLTSFNNDNSSRDANSRQFYRYFTSPKGVDQNSSGINKNTGIYSPNPDNVRGYIVNLSGSKYYTSTAHIRADYDTTAGASFLLTYPPQKTLVFKKHNPIKTHQKSKQNTNPPPTNTSKGQDALQTSTSTHAFSENVKDQESPTQTIPVNQWIKQDTVQSPSPATYSPIAKAVIDGDLREVRYLLKQGEDPNQFLGDNTLLFLAKQKGIDLDRVVGETSLLLLAIQNNYNTIAEELITHGANVNFMNVRGLTPLMAASQQGNLTMIDQLLAKGARINAKTQAGENAFYFATRVKHIEIIKRLLQHGLDVNQSFGSSYHPLLSAIGTGNKELVDLLLQHGANPLMKLQDLTLVEWASIYKQGDIFNLLLQKARQDSFQGFVAPEIPPLLKAANNGDLREVRKLLAEGTDPNQPEGGLPILAALKSGYHVIVKELLDHGADINLQNTHDGETVLMWAARKGDINLFKQVMSKNPEVNVRSKNGASALLFAPQGDNPEIVKILIDHGADINAKGHRGITPLSVAAQNGNPEIVKMLIEHGADVHAKTDFGESALEPAISKKHIAVVKQLLDAGIDATQPLNTGWYPLHVAATAGNQELVELLLKHGADPNAPIGMYKPLHAAISHGHNDIAGLLMQKTEKKRSTIYGLITDSKTGKPIQGGIVIIQEIGRIATIGKGGMYYLTNIPAGSYTLQTISPGYRPSPANAIKMRNEFISTYHQRLLPDQKDQTPFGLGSLIYRYASSKGRANVVVKYTSPKMRNLAHSNHINKIDQSSRQTLADWPAPQFENDLASARQNIKKELNAFLKDPDTGKEGVVDVYIGDYHLRN